MPQEFYPHKQQVNQCNSVLKSLFGNQLSVQKSELRWRYRVKILQIAVILTPRDKSGRGVVKESKIFEKYAQLICKSPKVAWEFQEIPIFSNQWFLECRFASGFYPILNSTPKFKTDQNLIREHSGSELLYCYHPNELSLNDYISLLKTIQQAALQETNLDLNVNTLTGNLISVWPQ